MSQTNKGNLPSTTSLSWGLNANTWNSFPPQIEFRIPGLWGGKTGFMREKATQIWQQARFMPVMNKPVCDIWPQPAEWFVCVLYAELIQSFHYFLSRDLGCCYHTWNVGFWNYDVCGILLVSFNKIPRKLQTFKKKTQDRKQFWTSGFNIPSFKYV